MSGYPDISVERYAIEDSGFAFIQKPLTPSALAAKVAELLDNK